MLISLELSSMTDRFLFHLKLVMGSTSVLGSTLEILRLGVATNWWGLSCPVIVVSPHSLSSS